MRHSRSDLGQFGVFVLGGVISGGATPEHAQGIERLGYGTLWVSGSPPAELSFAEPLLEATTSLKVATGVVNIWSADATTQSYGGLGNRRQHEARCPGRGYRRHVAGSVVGSAHVGEHFPHRRRPNSICVDVCINMSIDEAEELARQLVAVVTDARKGRFCEHGVQIAEDMREQDFKQAWLVLGIEDLSNGE